MADSRPALPPPPRRPVPLRSTCPPANQGQESAVVCERCQSEMFRMHAVWRCPQCGYKTDCCGW